MSFRVIYLDVTSSCKSPMNTGVQRVVRELYRSLRAVAEVTPVLWDPQLATYCTLAHRERKFLEAPFASARELQGGDAEPGRRANPVPLWSKFARSVLHRRNRIDLPARLTTSDTLFVPEIFQDTRTQWLTCLAGSTPARCVGVCHDAIALRRPDITPPARQVGFLEYVAALATFDHIVAVSRETADDLAAVWRQLPRADPPDVSVFPWPVNHAGRKPQDPSSRRPD